MDELNYTTYEAARILGVNESTIRRRCAEGKLPGAYLAVIRRREIWMIPTAALDGGKGVLQHVPKELGTDQSRDPAGPRT